MRRQRCLWLLPDLVRPVNTARTETLEMVRLDRSKAHLLDAWHGISPSFRASFDQMLAAGEIGFFWLDGLNVAAHVWLIVNDGNSVIDRRYLRIYPGEGYVHFLHTYPDYRRQHLAHSLMQSVIQYRFHEHADSIVRLKASVISSNVASMALMSRIGALLVGKSTHVRLLGMSFRFIQLSESARTLPEVQW